MRFRHVGSPGKTLILLAGERNWWGVGPARAEGGLGGADILNSACKSTIRPTQVPVAELTYSTSNWRPSATGEWLLE
jgi:hypothetical protein